MIRTLILYESRYGTSKQAAEILGCLLSMSKCCSIQEAPDDLQNYGKVVFVFSMFGTETAEKTKIYIQKEQIKTQLLEKKIGVVGVGFWQKNFPEHLEILTELLGREIDISEFAWGKIEIDKLTLQDAFTVRSICEKIGVPVIDRKKFTISEMILIAERFMKEWPWSEPDQILEPELLKSSIEKFINDHNTCVLATGANQFVRCTPIEYHYIEDKFYLISEGGLKFKGILQNSNVSLTIFDPFHSRHDLAGLQVTGKAKVIYNGSDEYYRIIGQCGLTKEKIEHLPIDMYLICIAPNHYEFLNAEFQHQGADVKQQMD